MHKRTFIRNDGRDLFLYGNSPHLEKLKVFRKNINKKIEIEFHNSECDFQIY